MTVHRAESSEQLHHFLNTHRIDAVVVEQQLGGFLTGLEILQRLREQLLRPLLIVIGNLSEQEKTLAAELRIDFVCSWDNGIDSICKSISEMMGLARHSGFLIPAAARQLVAEAEHIGVMPQLVVHLTKYLDDDSARVSDLAKDISSDPSVTGELMKLVNSSAFGLKSQITDVEAVVKYLGIRRTVSLVLELSFHAIRHSWHEELSAELMNWFGLRSVVNACVASCFAARRGNVSPDMVYVLALLQDIGILVLCQAHQQRYIRLLHQARTVAQLQLELIEKAELSFTHADVSAALLQQWEFPPSMIQLVLEHHGSAERLSEPDRKFLRLIQLGEAVANLRDVPSPQRHMRFQKCLTQSSACSPMDAKATISLAIQQSREVTSYFNMQVPEKDNWWTLLQKIQQNLAGEAAAGPTSDSAADSSPPADLRPVVVIIDDEPAIGKMLKFILNDAPFRIEYHESPPAISELPSNVAAVLCDVHLGQGSGVEFVRQLRAGGFTRPIMMVSGDRTRDTVVDSIHAGIVDYIAKPFSKESILEKFRKHGLLGQPAEAEIPIGKSE